MTENQSKCNECGLDKPMIPKNMETHTLYQGSEFNRLLQGKKSYRFMNDDEIHVTFQYHDGLNIDTNPFSQDNTHGLYFATEDYMMNYITFTRGKYMREVIIPDDAKVYTNFPECRADRLILGKKINISDWLEKEHNNDIEELVRRNGTIIMYIKDTRITPSLCQIAVENNDFSIIYIPYKYLSTDLIQHSVQSIMKKSSCDEKYAVYRLLFVSIWDDTNVNNIKFYNLLKNMYKIVNEEFDQWLKDMGFHVRFHEKLDSYRTCHF